MAENASWNQEGPITANRLAGMLRPFHIYPCLLSFAKMESLLRWRPVFPAGPQPKPQKPQKILENWQGKK